MNWYNWLGIGLGILTFPTILGTVNAFSGEDFWEGFSLGLVVIIAVGSIMGAVVGIALLIALP